MLKFNLMISVISVYFCWSTSGFPEIFGKKSVLEKLPSSPSPLPPSHFILFACLDTYSKDRCAEGHRSPQSPNLWKRTLHRHYSYLYNLKPFFEMPLLWNTQKIFEVRLFLYYCFQKSFWYIVIYWFIKKLCRWGI